MNTVDIVVNIRSVEKPKTLILFHKIYSTPYGIVNHWSTGNNTECRLEIIIDEEDLSINPEKITKSMNIINDEWEIADQMMLKLHEKGNYAFAKTKLF